MSGQGLTIRLHHPKTMCADHLCKEMGPNLRDVGTNPTKKSPGQNQTQAWLTCSNSKMKKSDTVTFNECQKQNWQIL